jgi:hypothetical protein
VDRQVVNAEGGVCRVNEGIKDAQAEGWPDRGTDLALWAGVLLPPVAWATQLSINYVLATTVCTGAGHIAIHVVTVASLLLVGIGALYAWRVWQETADPDDTRSYRRERRQFMAVSGLIFGVLFGAAIVTQWVPSFLTGPC